MKSGNMNAPASGVTLDAFPKKPVLVIAPKRGWAGLDLRELWIYRDLVWLLMAREVKLRYKQTGLGIVWVVLQPLLAAMIFAVVLGRFVRIPSDGMPYFLFVFTGLVAWNYFSGALQRAGNSLVTNSQLITKIYFPRLLIPVAHTCSVLIDLAVMLVVLIGFLVWYELMPTWRLAFLPFFLLTITFAAVGISLWLSALAVKYRDFVYVVPFMIQIWLFATPVIYPMSVVPESARFWYSLNPAVGFVEGFRWAILSEATLDRNILMATVGMSCLLLVSGAFYFRRVERNFADLI
jgi:lipopolysaccharide transport system permease protein